MPSWCVRLVIGVSSISTITVDFGLVIFPFHNRTTVAYPHSHRRPVSSSLSLIALMHSVIAIPDLFRLDIYVDIKRIFPLKMTEVLYVLVGMLEVCSSCKIKGETSVGEKIIIFLKRLQSYDTALKFKFERACFKY